ncbi:MAG: energy-coupling factor transporter ATPase [Candidatus Limnocylindria bacterium]
MSEPIVRIEGLWHWYLRGTPLQTVALQGTDLEIKSDDLAAIMGHTGSGKSTVVQHLNGLLRPHGGSVHVFGNDLSDPKLDVRPLRRRVGLVFQQPEMQLFDPTVGDDIAFGPRQHGCGPEEVRRRVRTAMEHVGLGFEDFKDRYTFGLSGGEMRRVALAGVLALEPELLVLDEPTAGLDPRGRRQLLDSLRAVHAEGGMALVIVSHDMDVVGEMARRVWVLAGGRTVMRGDVREVFARVEELRELGLGIPQVSELAYELRRAGRDVRADVLTADELAEALWTSSTSPAA